MSNSALLIPSNKSPCSLQASSTFFLVMPLSIKASLDVERLHNFLKLTLRQFIVYMYLSVAEMHESNIELNNKTMDNI